MLWKIGNNDLTGLFTSQPITVIALSTAPACRQRAPSAGAATLCPLAPHPPSPQQLPLACQARVVSALDMVASYGRALA